MGLPGVLKEVGMSPAGDGALFVFVLPLASLLRTAVPTGLLPEGSAPVLSVEAITLMVLDLPYLTLRSVGLVRTCRSFSARALTVTGFVLALCARSSDLVGPLKRTLALLASVVQNSRDVLFVVTVLAFVPASCSDVANERAGRILLVPVVV